jgi:hypothetical protein
MLGIAIVCGASLLAGLGRWAAWNLEDTATFIGIVATTFAWLLWIARPSFFPLGSGPDLTHHLLLIDYIEAHWTLVHDAAVQEFLGEMVQYTPGSHILTALVGAWGRTPGLHALHPVMAASVALKTGFVFLIAMRVLPRELARVPIAAIASISLFASQTYFLGAFAQYSFLAQVVAECFAVAMFWALTSWDQNQSRWLLALTGLTGAALFLTWPILIGPPLVLLGCLVVWPSSRLRLNPDAISNSQLWTRERDATIAIVPIAVVAALFSIGRMGYVVIAGTGGEAVAPTVRAYGWMFLMLSSVGIAIATAQSSANMKVPLAFAKTSRARTIALFAGAVLLQAAALFFFARARSNDPYMARKMFYMLLYPQAVAVSLTVGVAVEWISSRLFRWKADDDAVAAAHHLRHRIAWAIVIIGVVFVGRPLAGAPKSLIVGKHPATSVELEQAGTWAREHVDPHCVDYLVGDDNTAYWLHLAVLGNPRRGSRTGDNATYELTPALARWLTPGGLPYAITDLRVLPTDIKSGADIVAQFGSAAVLKRRGAFSCEPG